MSDPGRASHSGNGTSDTFEREYVGTFQGLTWAELHLDGGVLHCDRLGSGASVGGTCFHLRPGDRVVQIDVFDDAGTAPTGEVDFFDDERSLVGDGFPLCDGHGVYEVPAWATFMSVNFAAGYELCTDRIAALTRGAATHGHIRLILNR